MRITERNVGLHAGSKDEPDLVCTDDGVVD